jgi:hypothetical protein
MRCLECNAADVSERSERTAQGYRRFRCQACGKQFNERSGGILNRAQYPSDVIALVVFWRLRYKLSVRDLPEMFLIRGIEFSYEAVGGLPGGSCVLAFVEDRREFFNSTSKAAVSASALSLRCSSRSNSWTRRRSCRASTALAVRGSPRPAIASRFQVSSSVGYSPCSRHQVLRAASSIVAVTSPLAVAPLPSSAGCQRQIHWPRHPPPTLQRRHAYPDLTRHQAIAELSGGNSLALIRSL